MMHKYLKTHKAFYITVCCTAIGWILVLLIPYIIQVYGSFFIEKKETTQFYGYQIPMQIKWFLYMVSVAIILRFSVFFIPVFSNLWFGYKNLLLIVHKILYTKHKNTSMKKLHSVLFHDFFILSSDTLSVKLNIIRIIKHTLNTYKVYLFLLLTYIKFSNFMDIFIFNFIYVYKASSPTD